MRCAEHRFSRRHTIDFSTYIMWDGRLIEASARNISLQGLLLECRGLSSPVGIEIKICCIVARKYYEIAGHITHIKNGMIGIGFTTPEPEFQRAVLLRAESGKGLMRHDAIPAAL